MPAKSKEAIQRKLDNRKSKKDIMKEEKIEKLGGTCIAVIYGEPLDKEVRDQRTEYLYDLLYPERNKPRVKGSVGRTRKYKTQEEAKKAVSDRNKANYRKRKNADVKHYETKEGQAAHRGTPWYYLYGSAKNRANKDNLPFDIDCKYIASIWVEVCPILGIKLERGTGSISDNSPTLDKLIPELGYVKGNVNIISNRANRIKNNGTLDEIGKIYSWMKKKVT